MASDRTITEVEETFGMVPNWMENITPAAADHSWGLLRDLELGETELTAREKELVGLGAAAAIQCPYCTHFHTEAAKLDGATDAELTEAVNIASSTRYFSTILHGSQTDHDEFVAETDEMMAFVKRQGAPADD